MLQIETYRIEVDGYVVGKQRPRFSSRTMRVYTPTATREAEHRIAQAWKWSGCPILLTGPLEVTINVWTPRPKLHYRTAKGHEAEVKSGAPYYPTSRPDLDNCMKTALDALTGVAWRDDDQIVDAHLHKRFGLERWVIEVLPMACCEEV